MPRFPFVKGVTYEGLKSFQHTYGCNEQCLSVSVPPLKKGGQGGFYSVACPFHSEPIYDISYNLVVITHISWHISLPETTKQERARSSGMAAG
jgi:hypothetical protein